MRKISKLALICYVLSFLLLLLLVGIAYITQLVSHGTVLSNMIDHSLEFIHMHEERIFIFGLPIYGLLFQWRFKRLRKAAGEGEKVREFLFSKKELKVAGSTVITILILYPTIVFSLLISQNGFTKISYTFVGTINEVKDHFPPYNWLLLSPTVTDEEVKYRIKLRPGTDLNQDDLSDDIFPIFDELNLYGHIGVVTDSYEKLPEGVFEIGVNAAIRRNGVKRIVFHYFEHELAKLSYIEEFERIN